MNLQQLRAQHAFAFVQGYRGDRNDFLGLARTLPVMLQTNGLLATWAHLLAKAKKDEEYREALKALLEHFRAAPLRLVPDHGDAGKVFTGLWNAPASAASGAQLRRLTAEAIAFAVWLKRAAEALLDEGEGAANTGTESAELPPASGDAGVGPGAPSPPSKPGEERQE
jgi:CRISPR/Cas system CMR-associated protein Cmr5 small subunit